MTQFPIRRTIGSGIVSTLIMGLGMSAARPMDAGHVGSLIANSGFDRPKRKKVNPAGTKLARMAAECRIGMPRGTSFVGATITWPRSTARKNKG